MVLRDIALYLFAGVANLLTHLVLTIYFIAFFRFGEILLELMSLQNKRFFLLK